MPITIKKAALKYKDPQSGEYLGINAITDKTTAEQIAMIEYAGEQAISSIERTSRSARGSIPASYAELSDDVDALGVVATQLNENVDILNDQIRVKAPCIYTDTDSKFSFSSSEIASYEDGCKVICDAQNLENIYVLKAENIIPDFDAIKDNAIYSKDIGLTIHIEGESSGQYIYLRVNNNLYYNPTIPLKAEDKIRASCIVNGTYSGSEQYPIVGGLYFRNLDDTSTECRLNISQANFGVISSEVYTVEKDAPRLQSYIYIRAGTYNCDVTLTIEVTEDNWETIEVPQNGIVVLESDEIGNNGITLLPNKSAIRYLADTKTYIDDHVPDDIITERDITYLSPEMFGAAGDGVTDDYQALQQCVNESLQRGVAMRCFGKYLTTQPIVSVGNHQNIYIFNLIYTGSDAAFILTGYYNSVRIDKLYAYFSTGAGFRLQTDENNDANYNNIELGPVYAYSNAIEYINNYGDNPENRRGMYYNVMHVRRITSRQGNGILFHATGNQCNENSFWGKYVSCANGWLLYCDAQTSHSLRLYEFCFEDACQKGVYGSAVLTNCRTVECMDKKLPNNGDVGTIIKFKNSPYAKWYGTTIDYDCIDVSECDTFQEKLALMNQQFQNGVTPALAYSHAFGHGTNYVLGETDRLWNYYTRNTNGICPAGSIIAYFNHKGFVPYETWYHLITISDYTPLVTDKFIPTQFDIGIDLATIHLNDSYCCVGINEFTLIQYDDRKAIVYEKNNSSVPIFDGTNLAAGTYKFTCQRLPKSINLLYANGSVALTYIIDDIYFGDNEKWTIEKLNIIS